MKQILNHLVDSSNILLASHKNPDGDAVGSLIAMGLALESINKKVFLYNDSPIPAVYRFLCSVDRINREMNHTIQFDTAVILDCGDLERIGPALTVVNKVPVVINIDHHVTNTGFGHYQLIDTLACSTAEIIYRLIKKLAVPIDLSMATSIYTGILTDTGSFRFSNTNQAAFAICEEMTERGVKPYNVAQHVYGTYSLGRIKLLNLALDSIEISENGKLSIMTITQDMLAQTGTHPGDTDGMINYARRIEDVKVATLIQEHINGTGNLTSSNHYHVSLRSDGTVDVAAIAAIYGGGGHSTAAGFGIETTLSDLKTEIINLADKL
jgi:phosphoesterase RecJ-like protein